MPRTLLVALLALTALWSPVFAQDEHSPAELRRQLDQQAERISELEAQLARAEERVADLTEDNKKLRTTIRNYVKGGSAPSAPASGDDAADTGPADLPADPLACTDSALASLAASWEQEFGGADLSQQSRYIRDARRWAGKAARDHKGPISWRVRVVSATDEGRKGTSAMVQVLSPLDQEWGEPSAITATGSAARIVLAAPTDAVLVLKGTMNTKLTVNARGGSRDDQVGEMIDTEITVTVNSARYE